MRPGLLLKAAAHTADELGDVHSTVVPGLGGQVASVFT